MNILLTAPYPEEKQKELAKFGKIHYRSWKEIGRAYQPDELLEILRDVQADAIITEHDQIDRYVMDRHPLAFIGVCRGTPSNVDVEYARKKGIPVFTTPARNAQAVAELFIANLISFMRNSREGEKWLKEKKWNEGAHTAYLDFRGNEVAGKTVGMIGFGAVGQRIAGILKAFPATVQYYDPFLQSSPDPAYHSLNTMEEVFATSDIVSIHLPVNEQTRNIIDEKLLSLMKPDSVFINTSRAAVVKRDALLDVLKRKAIRGAILDVFDQEPPDEKDYEIIGMPHVLATPHIAGATHEVVDHHADIMNHALEKWFSDHQGSKKE
ncbi:2-hydroxyacid dehydrogenase [Kroppenstedtia pulmonis]|uniref:2-hydroxyacid dehydrogenase n=1 Tax=Kroppenstedtia pulmonis TaxID=1380685 RepID=A0A7D3XJV0_9BACL|nr:2-hydroxyacid dehydrogenase [Kroppenstedtia pulmonis]QKG85039.1 2-hydroxyacid dehydrogenase [Kroppenstedtia pulmonis]